MQQALERAGIKSNKGLGLCLNALEMASLMQHFKGNGIASAYATYEESAVTPQVLPISSNRTITSEARIERQPSAE
jgi:6,7-dimethyl-8-ribityllumazine synthase